MVNRIISMLVLFSVIILVACEHRDAVTIKLDNFMDAYDKYHSYKYNGAILISKGDKIILSNGYGMANFEEDIKNNVNSVFAIGSLTKSFTATSILILADRGLININDPLSNYIPGHPRADDIKVKHLLTHTSGLPKEGKFLGNKEITLKENIEYINNLSLQFEPGDNFSYSNAGYIMLAAVIEKVSGDKYNDFLRKNIFEPLDMLNTRGGMDDTYSDNQSIGYNISLSDNMKYYIYNFSSIIGSGNVYSTVNDLYKYDNGIKDLLSEEAIKEMYSPQWNGSSMKYGYGWFIEKDHETSKIYHGGNIGGGGYNSRIVKFPQKDYTLIFLTNNNDTTALDIVNESIEAILFDEEYVTPQSPKNIKIDYETLQMYSGEYLFDDGYKLKVTIKNDKLFTTVGDGSLYELIPISKTQFYLDNRQCTSAEFIVEDDKVIYSLRNISNTFKGEKNK